MLQNLVCRLFPIFKKVNVLKSIYYNFKYLPFRDALKFPIIVGYNTKLCGKRIEIQNISLGVLLIGVHYDPAISQRNETTLINVNMGGVIFKGRADIGKGTKIVVLQNAELEIGDSFVITGHSSFRVYKHIKIGSNCLISWDVLFMDYDGHEILDDSGCEKNASSPIIIGDKVWIGCRVSIWDGAVIPNGCIIGNSACIRKQLLYENSVYIGEGKMVKSGIHWK